MRKFQQKVLDFDTPEYFSWREEYLAAENGKEKMDVLIKYSIIFVDWRGNLEYL